MINAPRSFSGCLSNRLTGTELFSFFSMRDATQTQPSHGAVISPTTGKDGNIPRSPKSPVCNRWLSQYLQKLLVSNSIF